MGRFVYIDGEYKEVEPEVRCPKCNGADKYPNAKGRWTSTIDLHRPFPMLTLDIIFYYESKKGEKTELKCTCCGKEGKAVFEKHC